MKKKKKYIILVFIILFINNGCKNRTEKSNTESSLSTTNEIIPTTTIETVTIETVNESYNDINDIFSIIWKGVLTSPRGFSNRISYGDGRFVAVSDKGIIKYSDNGKDWTTVMDTTFGNSNEFHISDIYGIAYSNGIFVIGGSLGKMAYSTDRAETWTKIENSIFKGTILGIASNGEKFVAVSNTSYTNGKSNEDGIIGYSDDGIIWTAVESSPFERANIDTITFGKDKFIATEAGWTGRMAYSYDGKAWTAIENNIFANGSIRKIAYGGDRFVAVGLFGKIAYSDDGIIWTEVEETTLEYDSCIHDIAFGRDLFIAVGTYDSYHEYKWMAYSSDKGETWTEIPRGDFTDYVVTAMSIRSIAFGGGTFVLGGTGGMIAYSIF